jgi:hypothetical protein
MTTCYYHPQTKAKSICPDCGEDICDVCRLEGGLQRCGSCAQNGPPPGGPRVREEEPAAVAADPGGYGGGYDAGPAPAAHDLMAMQEVMCSNHPGTTADMQCLNCLQAYCMDCLPGGTFCAACERDPEGRAAPQDDYHPTPTVDPGYDPGLDFAGGYADEAPPPRPKRPPGAKKPPPGGAKKGGAPAAKKGGAKGKKAAGPPLGLIAGGVGALLLVGAGAWFMLSGPAESDFTGPTKVSITGPKATTVKGLQNITLQVASPEEITKVEVRVDGKYWEKFSAPPFTTEWQSSLVKNGKHTIEAVAEYKNGAKVTDKKTVTVANPS